MIVWLSVVMINRSWGRGWKRLENINSVLLTSCISLWNVNCWTSNIWWPKTSYVQLCVKSSFELNFKNSLIHHPQFLQPAPATTSLSTLFSTVSLAIWDHFNIYIVIITYALVIKVALLDAKKSGNPSDTRASHTTRLTMALCYNCCFKL